MNEIEVNILDSTGSKIGRVRLIPIDFDRLRTASFVAVTDGTNEYDDRDRIIEKKYDSKGKCGGVCGRSILCTCQPAFYKVENTDMFYCEGCALEENGVARREVCKRV